MSSEAKVEDILHRLPPLLKDDDYAYYGDRDGDQGIHEGVQDVHCDDGADDDGDGGDYSCLSWIEQNLIN